MLMALLLVATARAAPVVLVLPSDDTAVYREFIEALRTRPEARSLELRVLEPEPAPEELAREMGQAALLLPVGTRALHRLLASEPQRPVLAVMVSSGAYRTHLQMHDSARRLLERGLFSALFLEQPVSRMVALARLVRPRARRLGVVLGPASSARIDLLAEEAVRHGFRLELAVLAEEDNPAARINAVMKRSDVYLALPDRAVFNRSTARWVLYAGLRHSVPVVGFSARYTEAGAVASVYSTPADQAADAAEWLARWDPAGGILGPPRLPRHYSLSLNRRAATALGLQLPPPEALRRELEKLERGRP
ncbi:MAG: hypothetical protein D6786_04545 [Gammaproteobacteria bacterium]|nr:MAG: hypothetical protein D6786_04545 [Gammaproteobacteria bacterium]